jgi:hypothetical protein
MKKTDTLANLENELLEKIDHLENSITDQSNDEEKKFKHGVKQGLLDALHLVQRFKGETSKEERAATCLEPGQSMEKRQNLNQMGAEPILRLVNDGSLNLMDYPVSELAEAAFQFENELMTLLEDTSTIPFESYTELTKEKLVEILSHAANEIYKIEGL